MNCIHLDAGIYRRNIMAKEKKETQKSSVSVKDSIKTKLIASMLAVTIIPLAIALIVSYKTSTDKAMNDAVDSLDWQT